MENVLIEVVKLPVDDWPAYKALRLEALQDSPRAFSTTYSSMLVQPDSFWQNRLETARQGQGNWLLFARAGPRLVGMLGAFIEPDDPATAHIISVFVTGPARGKGIARLLMSAILSEIQHAGIKKARLGVTVDQLPALNLYKSFGFEIIHKEEHQLMADGNYHDEYVMEKLLLL